VGVIKYIYRKKATVNKLTPRKEREKIMHQSCGYVLDLARYFDLGYIMETKQLILVWNSCIGIG
jgi:hypothetical protein